MEHSHKKNPASFLFKAAAHLITLLWVHHHDQTHVCVKSHYSSELMLLLSFKLNKKNRVEEPQSAGGEPAGWGDGQQSEKHCVTSRKQLTTRPPLGPAAASKLMCCCWERENKDAYVPGSENTRKLKGRLEPQILYHEERRSTRPRGAAPVRTHGGFMRFFYHSSGGGRSAMYCSESLNWSCGTTGEEITPSIWIWCRLDPDQKNLNKQQNNVETERNSPRAQGAKTCRQSDESRANKRENIKKHH